jgi:hypothetical protein
MIPGILSGEVLQWYNYLSDCRILFIHIFITTKTSEELINTNNTKGQETTNFSPEVYVLAGMLVPVVSTNTWWFGG